MNGTFVEKLEIKDEWEISAEKYRLVDLGTGPQQLQVLRGDIWIKESACYEWSTLTSRIESLKNSQKS